MSSVIFHIDVNSAYLSWSAIENLKNGSDVDLRLIPSIIGGDMSKRHGVVLAKSLPAKAYGIRTGEPVINAFRKCPSLVTERPNHALYSRQSNELMQYLRSVCPDIEQVSIDECYMDFSPIAANYSSPEAAAMEIKNYIRDNFGFTVNVGISDKKVLAKMASDFKKPDLVHTLYSHEIREKMWPLPVSSLYMCGKSSVDTFRKLEILTIGDLAQANPQIINLHLKSHGQLLWNYANGLDDSVVEPESTDLKGIGNSITLSADALTAADCKKVLLSLSDTVAGRLRSHGQSAGMISTEIKYNTFQSVSHQTTLSTPVCTASLIYETACTLFDEIWDGTPVRLLGIRTSKLSSKDEPVQLSLFDYEEKKPKNEKLEKLDEALFNIRKKYGEGSIVRGSFLNSPDDYKKH